MYVFVLTSCTNYLSSLILRIDLSLKCSHQYYQIVFYCILFSLVLFFSLLGAVVSVLRALLHPPRLF